MVSQVVRFESTLRADFDPASDALRRISADGVQGLMRGKAQEVAAKARIFVPVDTGRLKGSIRVEQVRDPSGLYGSGWQVTASTPYALYVHEGTRAHIIRPVNAKALRFQIGGRTVFARSVNHPGTRARPFLTDALQAVKP